MTAPTMPSLKVGQVVALRMSVRTLYMHSGQFRPLHPPMPALHIIASSLGTCSGSVGSVCSWTSFRARRRTDRRFVSSTFSGRIVMRSRSRDKLCRDRCDCKVLRVSFPFWLLRVVKIIVRHVGAGYLYRKSSIKRRQIPRPIPLEKNYS